MNTSLAIYDALLQAKVSPDAARAVVDALEKDMNTLLATKQDLKNLEVRMDARFDTLASNMREQIATQTVRMGSMVALGVGVLFTLLKLT